MGVFSSSTVKLFISLALVLLALLAFGLPASAQGDSSWHAAYWNNMELSGTPAIQIIENKAPNIGWGFGSPADEIHADQFSARWTNELFFEPGQYRFSAGADDGVRLWVNDQLIIDEWHDSAGEIYTADMDVYTAGPIPIRLEYYEDRGSASIYLTWERKGTVVTTGPIKAEYFNNSSLQGTPALVRSEGPGLYHNWGNGSPDPSIRKDHFSARYTQAMNLSPGWYRFTSSADDGIRFWINNQLVIDRWYYSGSPETADLYLPGGIQNFLVYYYEDVGPASIRLSMTKIDAGKASYSAAKISPASTQGTVNTTALNMRSGPGMEFSPVRTLYKGNVVTLTGNYQGNWVHVRTQDNYDAWVAAQYLDFNMPTGSSTTAVPTPVPEGDFYAPAGDTSSTAPPKINSFTINPPSVQPPRCVEVSWRVEGGVDSVTITRNGNVIWQGPWLAGTISDCPSTPGFAIYVIEASGPVGTVKLQNCCQVTVDASQ